MWRQFVAISGDARTFHWTSWLLRTLLFCYRQFTCNFPGRFVFANTLEGCLAYKVVPGPRRERYLRHQLRFDPNHLPSGICSKLDEVRMLLPKRIQAIAQCTMR